MTGKRMYHISDGAEPVERVNTVQRLGDAGQRYGYDISFFDSGGNKRLRGLVDVLKKSTVADFAAEIIDSRFLRIVAVVPYKELIDSAAGRFCFDGFFGIQIQPGLIY